MLLIQQGSNWCPWCGGHMGWGGWMMMFWWVLILALVVAAIWWQARRRRPKREEPGDDRAEGILRERFARGEIDEATYRQQLTELRRSAN